MKIQNTFTIDTEDWFHVFYSFDDLSSEKATTQISKIEAMVDSALVLLNKYNVKCTFFCVGKIAETHPHVLKKIISYGHEIGCHGYKHIPCDSFTLEEFKEDVKKAKLALESVINKPVIGYRAPGFSLTQKNQNKLLVLKNLGFKYDSSLLSFRSKPYLLFDNFYEVPPVGINFGGKTLPTFGGFVFRFMPFFVMRVYFQIYKMLGMRINFYTHTWEFETDYPRVIKHPIKAFIQYYNLKSVHKKIECLLNKYEFTSIERQIYLK